MCVREHVNLGQHPRGPDLRVEGEDEESWPSAEIVCAGSGTSRGGGAGAPAGRGREGLQEPPGGAGRPPGPERGPEPTASFEARGRPRQCESW